MDSARNKTTSQTTLEILHQLKEHVQADAKQHEDEKALFHKRMAQMQKERDQAIAQLEQIKQAFQPVGPSQPATNKRSNVDVDTQTKRQRKRLKLETKIKELANAFHSVTDRMNQKESNKRLFKLMRSKLKLIALERKCDVKDLDLECLFSPPKRGSKKVIHIDDTIKPIRKEKCIQSLCKTLLAGDPKIFEVTLKEASQKYKEWLKAKHKKKHIDPIYKTALLERILQS